MLEDGSLCHPLTQSPRKLPAAVRGSMTPDVLYGCWLLWTWCSRPSSPCGHLHYAHSPAETGEPLAPAAVRRSWLFPGTRSLLPILTDELPIVGHGVHEECTCGNAESQDLLRDSCSRCMTNARRLLPCATRSTVSPLSKAIIIRSS